MINQNWNVLAVVRELHVKMGTASVVNGLPALGMGTLGLDPRVSYWQITLVKNDVRPNERYTTFAPAPLAQDLRRGVMVMAGISARVQGEFSYWVISHTSPL